MSSLHRFRPSPAMVVAGLALLVALGGTGIAAVTSVPRSSVGTPQLKNNAVTTAKVRNRSLLAVDFAPGQIPAGPAGPQGAAGPAGPAGPQGPAGTVTRLSAVINPSGSIARSQGTTSAGRVATGAYEVIFNQDVSACNYQATLGNPGSGTAAPGSITVSPRAGNVNGVFVATYDSTDSFADRSFYLAVVC